jgi:hypothetical protein
MATQAVEHHGNKERSNESWNVWLLTPCSIRSLMKPVRVENETSLLPVCCLCGLIRDEIDFPRWCALGHAGDSSERHMASIRPIAFDSHLLSGCLTQVMETMGSPGPGDIDGRLARGQEACLGSGF